MNILGLIQTQILKFHKLNVLLTGEIRGVFSAPFRWFSPLQFQLILQVYIYILILLDLYKNEELSWTL